MDDIVLHPLFVDPRQYQTEVWATAEVLDEIAEYQVEGGKKAQQYVNKMEYYAKAGFHRHEGPKEGIRPKTSWRNILAIEPWQTLFRVYGCYETPQKKAFMALSTTMKKGQKMRDTDKAAASYAEELCEARDQWRKDTGT